MRAMSQPDEPTAVEQVPLVWPTIDPDVAVSMLVQEAELLVMHVATRLQVPPTADDAIVRDLSPLGR